MSRRGSRVAGAGRVRKMLKRLPETLRDELAREMQSAGPTILGKSKAETPSRSGSLRSLLTWRFYPKSLRLRVGLIGARANRAGWYGRILEAGRKAQTVTAKRRTANGVIAYRLRVRAIDRSRYDIVRGRIKAFAKRLLRPVLGRAYEKALRSAASGAGSD